MGDRQHIVLGEERESVARIAIVLAPRLHDRERTDEACFFLFRYIAVALDVDVLNGGEPFSDGVAEGLALCLCHPHRVIPVKMLMQEFLDAATVQCHSAVTSA